MTGRPTRLALVVAVAAAGLGLFAPTSATASCVGPSISVRSASAGAAPGPGLPTVSTTYLPPSTGAGDGPATPVVRLAPGAVFTVTGEFFFSGCDDTRGSGSFGPGCSTGEQRETVTPLRAIPLTLAWNGREYPLGTADATGDRAVPRWEVTLPAEVTAGGGLAVLRAGTAQPVAVEVTG